MASDTLSSRIAAFESNIAKNSNSQDASFIVNAATRGASPRRKASRRSSLSDFTPRGGHSHSRPPPMVSLVSGATEGGGDSVDDSCVHSPDNDQGKVASPDDVLDYAMASSRKTDSIPGPTRTARRSSLSAFAPSSSQGASAAASTTKPLLVVNARGDLVPAYAVPAAPTAAAGNSSANAKAASDQSCDDVATVTSNTSRTTMTTTATETTNHVTAPASPRKFVRPSLVAKVHMFDKPASAAPSLEHGGAGPRWSSPSRRAPQRMCTLDHIPPHPPINSSTCHSPSKGPQQQQQEAMSPLTPISYNPPATRAMGRRSSLSHHVSTTAAPVKQEETGGDGEDVEYWRGEANKLKEDAEERKRKKAEQEAYRAEAKEKAKKRAEEAKQKKEMMAGQGEEYSNQDQETTEEIIRQMMERPDEQIITVVCAPNTRPTSQHVAAVNPPSRKFGRRSSTSDYVPHTTASSNTTCTKSWASPYKEQQPVTDMKTAAQPKTSVATYSQHATPAPAAAAATPARKFGRRSSTSAYVPAITSSSVTREKSWPPPKEQQQQDAAAAAAAEMAVVAPAPAATRKPASATSPARQFGRRCSTSDYVPPPAASTTTTAKSPMVSGFQPTPTTGLVGAVPASTTTATTDAAAHATTAAPMRRFGRRSSLSDAVPSKRTPVSNTWQSRYGQTTTPAPGPVPATTKVWKKPGPSTPSKEAKAAILIQSVVRGCNQRPKYRQMVIDKMYEDLKDDDNEDDDSGIPRASLRPGMNRGMSFKKCYDSIDDNTKKEVSSMRPDKTRGMSIKQKATSTKKNKKSIKEEEEEEVSDSDKKAKNSTKATTKSKKNKKSTKKEDSGDSDNKVKKSTKSKSKKSTSKEPEKTGTTAPKRKSLTQAAGEHYTRDDNGDDDSSNNDSGDEESTLGSWGNSGPRVPMKSKRSSTSNSTGSTAETASDSSNDTKLEFQYTFVFQR